MIGDNQIDQDENPGMPKKIFKHRNRAPFGGCVKKA